MTLGLGEWLGGDLPRVALLIYVIRAVTVVVMCRICVRHKYRCIFVCVFKSPI